MLEIKINSVINDGNTIYYQCDLNSIEEVIFKHALFGDSIEYRRILIREFEVVLDEAPESTQALTELAIELMITQYGYKKEDFIN